METCPACHADVELGRLTGILGIVCRGCDAYNEPGTRVCAGCGKPLGSAPPPPQPEVSASATPGALPPSAAAPGVHGPRSRPPAATVAAAKPPAAAVASPPPATPVIRAFAKGGGAATRVIPAAAPRAPGEAIPLVTRCPRCGAEASAGTFCSQCGQALGSRGTQVMAPVHAPHRILPQTYGGLALGHAELVLERGDGSEGDSFKLDSEVTELGRSRGISFPEDATLAPHHATFFYRDAKLHVRDEGAPGGVFIKLRGLSIPLRPGDHLVLGDRLLRFAGPVPPPPPPPPDGTRRLGAPRPAGAAIVLEELLEGGVPGRVLIRGGPSVTIGRAGCAVNLGEDPYLSQAHAEIVVERDGTARLRDLGSSNGTFVRIPPHAEREVRDADVLRIGRQALRVAVTEPAGP
jgi:pSer/pThr/pTyr-binding forkhead associated (FHA) protein